MEYAKAIELFHKSGEAEQAVAAAQESSKLQVAKVSLWRRHWILIGVCAIGVALIAVGASN
jgi:hypothetical protein